LPQGFIKFGLTSNEKYVTVEVLTAVFIEIQAFWYVMPCRRKIVTDISEKRCL